MQKRSPTLNKLQQKVQAALHNTARIKALQGAVLGGPLSEPLPTDVAALQAIIYAQREQFEQQSAVLAQTDALIESVQIKAREELAKQQARHWAEIAELLEKMRLDRHRMFGVSSEQDSSAQSRLFDEAETLAGEASGADEPAADIPVADSDSSSESTKQTKAATLPARGKRTPLAASLPRVDIVHDVPESERICPCGTPMVLIGTEVSEQLDIIPMQLRVLRHVRNKYACADSLHGPVVAALPVQLLPKSNASAELIAQLATLKYIDGVPLARIERKFEGFGAPLPRQTQARWMVKVGCEILQPLVNIARDALYDHDVMHIDETTVQVLTDTGKAATSDNYMWVQTGGPPSKPVTLFHYAPGRGGDVADELLTDFSGYVMADGYTGYNAATQVSGKIKRQGCWAHARRYFKQSHVADPQSKKQTTSVASQAIALIGKLYGIERAFKVATTDERYAARQTQAMPVLAALRALLEKSQPAVPPKTVLGKALTYLSNQWDCLIRYTERGDLPIDNNRAENAIRPFVIGRKNWLFSDTVRGAKASANWYSLIETAKANGLEPHTWLRHVLHKISDAKTAEDYDKLMPWNVKRIGSLTVSD